MKIVLPLLMTSLAFVAGSVDAQDRLTPHSGAPALDLHQMDMNRMRIEADARAAYQREQSLTTRLNRLEIQSRRQPALVAPPLPPLPPLDAGAPLTAQTRREAVTLARIQTEGAAGEINQWLDREPQ